MNGFQSQSPAEGGAADPVDFGFGLGILGGTWVKREKREKEKRLKEIYRTERRQKRDRGEEGVSDSSSEDENDTDYDSGGDGETGMVRRNIGVPTDADEESVGNKSSPPSAVPLFSLAPSKGVFANVGKKKSEEDDGEGGGNATPTPFSTAATTGTRTPLAVELDL